MDNVTHTLIGLTAAELVYRARLKKTPVSNSTKALWFVSSMGGNNFPDIDVFFRIFDRDVIVNLLHHRGYTHTILGAFPQAFIIMGLLKLMFSFKKNTFTKEEWRTAFWL